MTKTLCIYHENCADGFAAAWVVRKAMGDQVEFYPATYGDAPPNVAGRRVILVDFSYPRAVLEQLADQVASLLILDHHKSALEDLAGFIHPKVNMTFALDYSGARLAWTYFFPDQAPPPLLLHIEDRDLWRFALDGTREIQACLFSLPYDFDMWDRLMELDDLSAMRREGQAIDRKHHKDIEELLKITTRLMVIGGHCVPVANLPHTMASDATGLLAKDTLFAATYYDTEKERVFSLRSCKEGLDVSEVAKQYGGGGHRHAAGFRVSLQEAWVIDMRVGRPCAPDTIGVELTEQDQDRLEKAVSTIQSMAPQMSIDDCIDTIFTMGLALAETLPGLAIIKLKTLLDKTTKESA